jgi:hypothetical protein
MAKFTFKIGEAFPASDPVARFITVLAMISNDWLRSFQDMLGLDDADPDSGGRSVALFRQQAALHHEAAVFIREARRRFVEVNDFIASLPPEAQRDCDRIVGGIVPASPNYHGDWLATHRNMTFHYPEMHPEITAALESAAQRESSIEAGSYVGSVRFRFADEVAVQWLPAAPERRAILDRLTESVRALVRFADEAIWMYMNSRPSGTFTGHP